MVGVLAVQGDFDRHAHALLRAGATEITFVRTPSDLERVDRLVIPGGESTTVGLLLRHTQLDSAIVERARASMPVWGTCMGLILMAREVEGREQATLGLLDVTVRRNAFGTQVHSFEDSVSVRGLDGPLQAVFIRAPIVTRLGVGVEELAVYEGKTVAVRQGRLLGTSFHPELSDDARFHEWFLSL